MFATREFRAAAHHALFAEKMLPILSGFEAVIVEAEAVALTPSRSMPLKARTELGERYKVAKQLVPQIRAMLYPED